MVAGEEVEAIGLGVGKAVSVEAGDVVVAGAIVVSLGPVEVEAVGVRVEAMRTCVFVDGGTATVAGVVVGVWVEVTGDRNGEDEVEATGMVMGATVEAIAS